MNRTSIEWCDYTWNPITGCLHPCRYVYCYNTMKATSPLNRFGARYRNRRGKIVTERNWKKRQTGGTHIAKPGEIYPYGYDPTFYPHRLNQPEKVKKPSKIFVVDTGDMFGEFIPEDWIRQIMDVVKKCPWHTFMFLTKNPGRMLAWKFPPNAWAGTTVTSNADRARAQTIKKVRAGVRYLSIEPLLGRVSFDLRGIQWIILGAQTGKNPKRPERQWIDEILEKADRLKIPVFMKNNIRGLTDTFRIEYPV